MDGKPEPSPGNFSFEVFGRFADTVVKERFPGLGPGFPLFRPSYYSKFKLFFIK